MHFSHINVLACFFSFARSLLKILGRKKWGDVLFLFPGVGEGKGQYSGHVRGIGTAKLAHYHHLHCRGIGEEKNGCFFFQ